MKTAFAASLIVCASALAGDLNPPAGPVTETMKTLDDIEPRIALSQDNTPGDATARFIITEPGSYYLTEGVTTGFNESAVRVNVGNVTIDLNGFCLDWDGDSDGLPVHGIDAAGRNGVRVMNGTISTFTQAVTAGISASVERLTVGACEDDGIELGEGSSVRECVVRNTDGIGIRVGAASAIQNCNVEACSSGIFVGNDSIVRQCTVRNSTTGRGVLAGSDCAVIDTVTNGNAQAGLTGVDNVVVRGCTSNNNTRDGIVMNRGASIENCSASENGMVGIIVGLGSSVNVSASISNSGAGFRVGPDASVSASTAYNNTEDGFLSVGRSAFVDCTANSNGQNGFEPDAGSTLTTCTARNNSFSGISAAEGSLVESCNASGNAQSGIGVRDRSTVRGNLCESNGLVGISLRDECHAEGNTVVGVSGGDVGVSVIGDQNVVDGNVVTNCGTGYRTSANLNVFTRNVSRDNPTAYNITGVGNQVATVRVSPIGAGAWDNFEY